MAASDRDEVMVVKALAPLLFGPVLYAVAGDQLAADLKRDISGVLDGEGEAVELLLGDEHCAVIAAGGGEEGVFDRESYGTLVLLLGHQRVFVGHCAEG